MNLKKIEKIKNPLLRKIAEYAVITVSIELMVIGIYFFKFPNHFSFGGISGLASVVNGLTGIGTAMFTNAANVLLLVLGFLFLGRGVGVRTVYSTVVMTLSLEALEAWCPLAGPLTTEPLLDLVYAILLPGIASAILFEIGASSGGTDIIAMILRKYTSMNIGTALMVVDFLSVALAFVAFGPETGMLSTLGLLLKSIIIDMVVENIRLTKCFNIICDEPEPICRFVIDELHHGATVYQAMGAYTHKEKYIVMTMMNRREAIRLRNFIRSSQPGAFIQITNSSEIIGKGFSAGN